MSRVTNMTVGDPKRLILGFAFPIILTNIGQQLYNVVDTAIVGRGVGIDALAAVGCTTWIYGVILWSILAITYGFSTFVSRYFGKGDTEQLNHSLAMSCILSLILTVVFTAVGLLLSRPLLEIMQTPDGIIGDAALYLYVMIGGTWAVMGYNLTSSVLRAFGDGKSPLIAMIIAALLNVGLDVLFVMVLPWGVFGAALASVISQAVSFVYCIIQIKKIECVSLKQQYFKWDGRLARELMVFSMPLGIMNATLAIGGLVLQVAVNLEGSVFIAGYTATNRLYGMFECTAIALGHAITTFMSQNFGKGDMKRVRQGFKTSFIIAIIFAIIVMCVMMLLGKPLLSLFIDPTDEGADLSLDIAFKYLFIMLCFQIVLYLLYVYRSTLQSLGTSLWSMLSGFAEFVARVLFALLLYPNFGARAIYYVESAAWLAALVVVIPPCCYHLAKIKKKAQI